MDTDPRHTEPTVAELRQHLATERATTDGLQSSILGAVIDLLDSYRAERGLPALPALPTEVEEEAHRSHTLTENDRSIANNFPPEQRPFIHELLGLRRKREGGEEAIKKTPQAIAAANGAGITAPDIAACLSVTPSHVYTVLRKGRQGAE
ncbi:hypothetical protein [Streptomyces sp. NBC_00572]|uniref:hypothetical protein n=1 Tax=Streptomyces sp. NBC_00572 TaxID=2903664 RepID=UPI00225A792F|nr:hypothetical protein [Streptomyces sp. NBC_00572]MCX4987139.1 hypothetical protein [Streptomyces sp. NBC_00572]